MRDVILFVLVIVGIPLVCALAGKAYIQKTTTKTTNYSMECRRGVYYYHAGNALAVVYNKDGSVMLCEEK